MADSTSNSRKKCALAAILCLLVAGLAGCAEDTPSEWGGFDDDGTNDDDTVAPNDPGNFFLPKTIPEDSTCRNDWCWIHPRPFGHHIRELREVNGDIYGVIGSSTFQGSGRFVWGDGFEVLSPPAGDVANPEVLGATVSSDGWLELTNSGNIRAVGPEGSRGSYQLPDGEYIGLDGEALSTFIVGRRSGGGYVRREDSLTEFSSDQPLGLATTTMWPNGDIWKISQESTPTLVDSFQRVFPKPPVSANMVVPAIGPDPTSRCADGKIWSTFGGDNLYSWNGGTQTWSETGSEVPWVSDFTCYGEGYLFAVTLEGEGYTRSEGEWKYSFGNTQQMFFSTESLGGSLYVGGLNGSMFRISSGEVNRVTSGFQPPHTLDNARGRSRYRELWVSDDASEGVVVEAGGIYRLTEDGSREMSIEEGGSGFRRAGLGGTEVWGTDEPEFLMSLNQFYRWDDSRWVPADLPVAVPDEARTVGLDGVSNDAVWLAFDEELFRYDGEAWEHLSAPGTSLGLTIDSKNLTLTDLYVDSDGQVWVAAGADLYRVRSTGGSGWEMTRETTTPCNRVFAMHRDANGTLWAAGDSRCVASRRGGTWNVLKPNFDWPENDPGGLGYRYAPTWGFAEQPDSNLPLVVVGPAIAKPTEDDTLNQVYRGDMIDLAYLRERNVTLALRTSGLLANYH